jgi:hypothetical protein
LFFVFVKFCKRRNSREKGVALLVLTPDYWLLRLHFTYFYLDEILKSFGHISFFYYTTRSLIFMCYKINIGLAHKYWTPTCTVLNYITGRTKELRHSSDLNINKGWFYTWIHLDILIQGSVLQLLYQHYLGLQEKYVAFSGFTCERWDVHIGRCNIDQRYIP